MISIFAFSLWLWVCLSVQESEAKPLTIKTVRRVDHGNGNLEFIVDFEGGSSTEAVWWKGFENVRRLQGTTAGGTTKVSVQQRDFSDDALSLTVGDLSRQYFLLELKTAGSGNKLSQLNLRQSTVDKTDVVFVPGNKPSVNIVAANNRVTSHVFLYDKDISVSLDCMAEGGTKFSPDNLEKFVEMATKTSEDGAVTNTLKFISDDPMNCYVYNMVAGVIKADEHEQSALETGLWEYMVLTVHEEGKEIGFPVSDPFQQ